jgi:hypothetical protein
MTGSADPRRLIPGPIPVGRSEARERRGVGQDSIQDAALLGLFLVALGDSGSGVLAASWEMVAGRE